MIDLALPVRAAAVEFQRLALEAGLSVLIYCTLRSCEEQAVMYAQGRTTAGAIVTNCRAGMSRHNPDKNGLSWAFDAVPLVNGDEQWSNEKLILKMGVIGESVGLEWAGRWTGRFRESVHFQIKDKK